MLQNTNRLAVYSLRANKQISSINTGNNAMTLERKSHYFEHRGFNLDDIRLLMMYLHVQKLEVIVRVPEAITFSAKQKSGLTGQLNASQLLLKIWYDVK